MQLSDKDNFEKIFFSKEARKETAKNWEKNKDA